MIGDLFNKSYLDYALSIQADYLPNCFVRINPEQTGLLLTVDPSNPNFMPNFVDYFLPYVGLSSEEWTKHFPNGMSVEVDLIETDAGRAVLVKLPKDLVIEEDLFNQPIDRSSLLPELCLARMIADGHRQNYKDSTEQIFLAYREGSTEDILKKMQELFPVEIKDQERSIARILLSTNNQKNRMISLYCKIANTINSINDHNRQEIFEELIKEIHRYRNDPNYQDET